MHLNPATREIMALNEVLKNSDVTYEDQQKINTFSRLNVRVNDFKARMATKRAAAEDLEEAGNEVMLLDDETVPFMVGECVVHLPREDVEERLTQLQEAAAAEVRGMQAEVEALQTQMAELKTVLYARFGSAINLEE